MKKKDLIEQIKKLPPEAQQEAVDFVNFLSNKYLHQDESSSQTSVLDSPFRGMWKDRDDLKDSTQWVRKIRKNRFLE